MRAAFFERPGLVLVKSVPDPPCPEGGLLTKVNASAICGSDLRKFVHGGEKDRIPGHETVSTVIEVGEGVRGFEVGDRVTDCPASCGTCRFCLAGKPNLCPERGKVGGLRQGGFAELRPIGAATVGGGFVIKIPEGVDSLNGTLTEPLACVLNGHEKVNVKVGDHVAVLGAGPIGCMHVAVSRMKGAGQIIVTDILQQRLDMARVFEADAYVNAANVDPVLAVRELTEGRGADVVIVACVSRDAQVQALKMASRSGQVLLFAGLPPHSSEVFLDTNLIHYHELSVVGARSSVKRQWDLALQLLRSGKVNPEALLTHTVGLESIQEGFSLARSGEAMKVAVVP